MQMNDIIDGINMQIIHQLAIAVDCACGNFRWISNGYGLGNAVLEIVDLEAGFGYY